MPDIKTINETKAYSAREALPYLTEFFKPTQVRAYLREDIEGDNIFNAKVYTANKQARFVIMGADLANGVKMLRAKHKQK